MADDNISELVKASIESRIIEAFRGDPQMIDELVSARLQQECRRGVQGWLLEK